MIGKRPYGIGRFGYLVLGHRLAWRLKLQSLRFFAFGASYLFAGIYSLGLGIYLTDKVMPISGYVALVTVPDALFPYEVMLFIVIGAAFVMASAFEFRRTIQLAGSYWDNST